MEANSEAGEFSLTLVWASLWIRRPSSRESRGYFALYPTSRSGSWRGRIQKVYLAGVRTTRPCGSTHTARVRENSLCPHSGVQFRGICRTSSYGGKYCPRKFILHRSAKHPDVIDNDAAILPGENADCARDGLHKIAVYYSKPGGQNGNPVQE
jgi:hypothetical protein